MLGFLESIAPMTPLDQLLRLAAHQFGKVGIDPSQSRLRTIGYLEHNCFHA